MTRVPSLIRRLSWEIRALWGKTIAVPRLAALNTGGNTGVSDGEQPQPPGFPAADGAVQGV